MVSIELLNSVVDESYAYDIFGRGMSITNGDIELGQLCPQDVEEGNGFGRLRP